MDALITAAQQPAAARQSASGCGVTRESDAAAAAVAALDSTKRLLEYALLLGLSRSEAVAYLQRTAGLQPALTELVWDKLAAQNTEYFAQHAQRVAKRNECCTGSQGSGCAFCCRLVAAFLAAPLPAPRAEDDTAASFCPDQASQPAACGLGGYHASHTQLQSATHSAQLA